MVIYSAVGSRSTTIVEGTGTVIAQFTSKDDPSSYGTGGGKTFLIGPPPAHPGDLPPAFLYCSAASLFALVLVIVLWIVHRHLRMIGRLRSITNTSDDSVFRGLSALDISRHSTLCAYTKSNIRLSAVTELTVSSVRSSLSVDVGSTDCDTVDAATVSAAFAGSQDIERVVIGEQYEYQVECAISGLGALRNRVVAHAAAAS